jgi:diguanylate cyclase (GGDEF)-like protein
MDNEVPSVDRKALMEQIGHLKAENARLEARVAELDAMTCMDVLVPAANRRGLTKQLTMVLGRHERHGTPAAMMFIDVDGLKNINDRFGHVAGDRALIHLTSIMSASVRKSDLVARIGGDEFAILLDHSTHEIALEAARRLATRVAETDLLHDGQALALSIAIGVTMIEKGDTPETVLDRADRAMYRVKAAA